MKIAHFINELITHSELLIERVRKVGVRQFIKDLYETLKTPSLTYPENTNGDLSLLSLPEINN